MTRIFALALALAGCDAAPSQPPAPSAASPGAAAARARVVEREPNDSAASAQLLPALPVEIAGTLDAGDVDLYRLRIEDPGAHLLDAWVEGLPGARVAILRPDGTLLADAAAPARIGGLGAIAGEFLLRVDGAAGAYRVMVERARWSRGLDWEPDDDADHAQELAEAPAAPGELTRHRGAGSWSRPGDVDCFSLPLAVPPSGALVRVSLAPPPGVRARLVILDGGDAAAHLPRARLAEAIGAAPGLPVLVPALGARAWEPSYAICAAAEEGFDPAARYRLDARLFAPDGPFEFEPNDARGAASALPRDTTVRGYLPPGDVDWFRISSGGGGTVTVEVRPPAHAIVELGLRDLGGALTASARSPVPGAPAIARGAAAWVELRAAEGATADAAYELVAR